MHHRHHMMVMVIMATADGAHRRMAHERRGRWRIARHVRYGRGHDDARWVEQLPAGLRAAICNVYETVSITLLALMAGYRGTLLYIHKITLYTELTRARSKLSNDRPTTPTNRFTALNDIYIYQTNISHIIVALARHRVEIHTHTHTPYIDHTIHVRAQVCRAIHIYIYNRQHQKTTQI